MDGQQVHKICVMSWIPICLKKNSAFWSQFFKKLRPIKWGQRTQNRKGKKTRQPVTRMVKAIEVTLPVEVNERIMSTRSPNTAETEGNGPAWRVLTTFENSFELYLPGKNNKANHMHYITLWKAAFDCNYCKFYSLFGNLFHLNMKSRLQWISQNTHKTIMNLHNRVAQDGLLVPVKLTKTHQAHLKWNLYNRQGPTNANGTV